MRYPPPPCDVRCESVHERTARLPLPLVQTGALCERLDTVATVWSESALCFAHHISCWLRRCSVANAEGGGGGGTDTTVVSTVPGDQQNHCCLLRASGSTASRLGSCQIMSM
jgi:hypothetical protein